MPPALKALLAQLAGGLLAFGAARSGMLPAGLWPLIAVQAIGAAGIATALRSAPDRRDIGITFMNDEELFPVNYYFGVFNGAGPSFNRLGGFFSEQPTAGCAGGTTGQAPFPSSASCPTPQRNINANLRNDINQLMYSARLNWKIMGRPGYGEGDLAYSETPQMAVGGGIAYNPSVNTSSNSSYIGTDLANLNFRRQIAHSTADNSAGASWTISPGRWTACSSIEGFPSRENFSIRTSTGTTRGCLA